MPKLRLLLFPFSLVYGGIIRLRNKLFDHGLLASATFPLPLICIGNLKVGGSGKTPFTEYLIRLLMPYIELATLSRGYGRSTKGVLLATSPADARMVGDEPAQFKNKFPALPVCVAEDRRKGISYLISRGIRLVLLDDAFQHRSLRCGLNLVLMEYEDVFKPVIMLPAGNYREPLSSLKRAAMVIITKTSVPVTTELSTHIRHILGLKPAFPLFFSGIDYEEPCHLYGSQFIDLSTVKEIVLLTGIANPGPLVSYLRRLGIPLSHHRYADHHPFSMQNMHKLLHDFRNRSQGTTILLTTEKDAQRLQSQEFTGMLSGLPFYYLPIRSEILQPGRKEFETFIFEYVNSAI